MADEPQGYTQVRRFIQMNMPIGRQIKTVMARPKARALVQEVDDRLVAARAPKCGAAERASVVQALLASAPDESAEDALDRAARLVRAARRGGAAVASGFA